MSTLPFSIPFLFRLALSLHAPPRAALLPPGPLRHAARLLLRRGQHRLLRQQRAGGLLQPAALPSGLRAQLPRAPRVPVLDVGQGGAGGPLLPQALEGQRVAGPPQLCLGLQALQAGGARWVRSLTRHPRGGGSRGHACLLSQPQHRGGILRHPAIFPFCIFYGVCFEKLRYQESG